MEACPQGNFIIAIWIAYQTRVCMCVYVTTMEM